MINYKQLLTYYKTCKHHPTKNKEKRTPLVQLKAREIL